MSAPIPTSRSDRSAASAGPGGTAGARSAESAGAARHASRIGRAAARRMVLRFALFAAALALAVCLVTILLDPLQFYRRASLLPPVFSTEERYQNPGLAKNYDYDTIILGTSMTENFLPSVVDEALGGRSIKLSMEGSMADEQYKIAKLALGTGKVKKVLWGLDYFAFKQADEGLAPDFPDYLYDDSWLNDYRYWFNASVYEMLLKNIARLATTGANRDLEHLYNWNAIGGFDAARVVRDYRVAGQNEQYFGLNEEPLEVVKASFEQNVLALVKQYPQVEFTFFYPPYSILRQDVWKRTNELRYRNQLEMGVWMFRQLDLPNVRVYDFQTEADWTYDLDLYRDLSHYSQDVNTGMAEAIGRDDPRYRMTADNAQSFADKLEEQLARLVVTDDNRALDASVTLSDSGAAARELRFGRLAAPNADELLVPAKELAAALGAESVWDAAAKELKIRLRERELVVGAGLKKARLDDSVLELDKAPRIVQGTLLVPLLSVSRALGATAELNRQGDHAVRITLALAP